MDQSTKTQKLKRKKEDPREMIYLKEKLNEIKEIASKKLDPNEVKRQDFTKPLPNKLYKRVNQYVNLASKKNAVILDEDENVPEEPKKIIPCNCQESLDSITADAERLYVQIDLQIEPKPQPRKEVKVEKGWMGGYVKKNKHNRIKWQSKVHQLEKRLLEKPMFDQAEELIDLAASDFSAWINSLNKDKKSNITKEFVKELFPIGLEGEVSKALYVEPKQIKAIPNEVGKNWNLPELALENNVIRIEKHNKRDHQKPKLIAFGRTLPTDSQVLKKKLSFIDTADLVPYFPEDLKSKEVLFRGIHHLRSTKALIQHLIDTPEIEKPTYLQDIGLFELSVTEEKQTKHVPLYEYFMKA